MKPEEHIGMELKRLDNEIHSRMAVFRAETGADDLTMMQSWIIGFLYKKRDQEIFQKDIEAEFSIARSTATGILQLMEKKGYIKREAVPGDARLKKIVLTPEGRATSLRVKSTLDAMEEDILKDISKEELDIYFSVADKIIHNLDNQKSEGKE